MDQTIKLCDGGKENAPFFKTLTVLSPSDFANAQPPPPDRGRGTATRE